MSDDRDSNARRKRRWLLAWVLGAVALLVVLVVALELTGRPSFCRTCHEMRPTVDAFRQGAHAELDTCFPCHANPGFLGYMKAHVVDGLRDVWVHTTRHPTANDLKSHVPPKRCLRCHDKNFSNGSLPSDHPKKTAYCPDCHFDAAHPGIER